MIRITFEGSAPDIRNEMRDWLVGTSDTPTVRTTKAKKETVANQPAEPAVEASPTVESVKSAIIDLLAIEAIGKPGVIKLFADHFAPAKKASELKPGEYASFVQKAKALIGA